MYRWHSLELKMFKTNLTFTSLSSGDRDVNMYTHMDEQLIQVLVEEIIV